MRSVYGGYLAITIACIPQTGQGEVEMEKVDAQTWRRKGLRLSVDSYQGDLVVLNGGFTTAEKLGHRAVACAGRDHSQLPGIVPQRHRVDYAKCMPVARVEIPNPHEASLQA